MNRWATRGLLIVIFLLGGAVVACGATTHYVNPGESIQAAIDAASPGDTIEIAAGTYQESLASWKDMEITKSLNLIGAGSGQTIVELREGPMNGVEIRGTDLDVLIEGITFTREGANDHSSGFALRVAETTSTFTCFTLRDVEVAYASGPDVNLCSKGTFDEVVIENCDFHHGGTWGLYVQGNVTQMTVINSTFADNGQVDADHGIGFDLTGYATNVTVSGGVFNGNTACGINLMRVQDSTFSGFEANNNGQFGVKLDEWGGKSENVIFEDFVAVGNGLDGITIQPEKDDAISDVSVRNAWLSGNGRNGVNLCYVYSGSNNPEMEGIVVTGCYLEGNGNRGLAVYSWWVPMTITDTFDASGNWWGTDDPTVVAGLVDPTKIDFSPILNGGADGDPGTPGWQPDLSSVTVHTLGQQVGIAGRITEGAGLVPANSTVNVAAGTYSEQVSLSAATGLTLCGNAAGRPVIEDGIRFVNTTAINGITFENLVIQPAPPAGGRAYIFKNSNSGAINDFVLKNCELDGEGVDNTHGIAGNLFGGSFTVEDCLFKDIYGFAVLDIDSSSDYSPHGGNGLPLTTVTFANNTIEDCDGSVALRGHTPSRTGVVNAYGNTWTNIGGHVPATDDHWAALEVNHAVVANVYGNTIHGVPLGIWGEGQAFQFWDIPDLRCGLNVITDNAQGIWIFGGSAGGAYGHWTVPGGIVTLNKIVGNVEYGIGVDPAAISGTLDATCNWWGSVDGPDADHDFDGTVDYAGGGDAAMGAVIYSPWLGSDPDGDPTTPGVQLTQPLYIIVADVGPVPQGKTIPGYVTQSVAGYLNRAIGTANAIAGTDTIEVRHGTYDVSEPITDGVNMVSEVGSASHTTLNGDMSINGDGVRIGLPLQGFRINGDVTIGAGADAATSRINWSDLYGYVTNNGTGTFDAQYNFWGTKEFAVVDERTTGLIDFEPFLPKNADDSYNDVVILLDAGAAASLDLAIQQLWTMDQLGQNVNAFLQYLSVAGVGASGGSTPGSEIILGGAAGAGGGVETTLSGTFTAGDLIEDGFTITDPLTGEPITDAAVTLSLLGPDGSNALAFWGAATYDEATGLYVFSIDTSGMAPGTYELIIQTDDGQSKTLEIVIEES